MHYTAKTGSCAAAPDPVFAFYGLSYFVLIQSVFISTG